jgi:hypothetical protein
VAVEITTKLDPRIEVAEWDVELLGKGLKVRPERLLPVAVVVRIEVSGIAADEPPESVELRGDISCDEPAESSIRPDQRPWPSLDAPASKLHVKSH